MLALLLAANAPLAAQETEAPEKQPIGTVHMEQDGTLQMMLRATHQDGTVGDAMLVLPPENPAYQQTIDRVGGLKPGETKTLYE